MTMQRYVLRQQSATAPTSDEIGAVLTDAVGIRILDQGARHLFVAGADPTKVLANAHILGWSVTPEQRYKVPEQPVQPLRAPKAASHSG